MRLAFYRGPVSILGKIIEWRTNGTHCHVELVFEDGTTFSSFINGVLDLDKPAVRYSTLATIQGKSPQDWDIVDLGPQDEAKAHAACAQYLGQRYDALGLADFFADIHDDDRTRKFCSCVVTLALQAIGLFPFLTATKTSPEELWAVASAYAEELHGH